MTKFTNITAGPKGVHTKTGLVYINAGETSEDLDVSEGELASATATGHFKTGDEPETKGGKKGGKGAKAPEPTPEPETKGEPTDDELRAAVVAKYGDEGAADLDRDAMLALLAA